MAQPRVTEVKTMTLLPPAPDACQECAVKHPPEQPHNPQSLYWATKRKMESKPPPTWEIALEHCPQDVYDLWVDALATKHGVKVKPRGGQR